MPRLPLSQRLPVPLYAAGLLVASCVGFAAMNGIIRHLGTTLAIDPLEIVFFRNLFAFLAMTPWLARKGLGIMKTDKLWTISTRVFWGFLSMAAWFSALAIVPLSNAVALSFTAPLFATVAAVFILGERIRARRIGALVVGFLGMLVILRPGHEAVGWGEVIVVASAFTMALSIVTMKKLTRTERPECLVVWQNMLLTPVSLLPALFFWSWPSAEAWFWLIMVGVIASGSHVLFTRAFSLADTGYLMPFDYVRLPFVALIGWLAFGEATDVWTWVGAAIIAGSTIYVARREALARENVAAGAASSPHEAGPREP